MFTFSSKGSNLLSNINIVAKLIILFYVINFVLSKAIGKIFKYNYENTTMLILTTITKNSPMNLGIALMTFPSKPIIHLIMLLKPLIELSTIMIITRFLLSQFFIANHYF